jgi:hypothetical protein
MAASGATLPNVAELLAGVLQRVAEPERPLLVALAERLAARRYRRWADERPLAPRRAELLACAEREEAIAQRIESLHADAAALQTDMLARHPDLEEIDRSVFAGRPLADQLAIQAQGERAGAALWRSLARRAAGEAERATYLACAGLEEESAACLDSLLPLLR